MKREVVLTLYQKKEKKKKPIKSEILIPESYAQETNTDLQKVLHRSFLLVLLVIEKNKRV